MEGDLKVEHVNCQFKAALMHLQGNYTEDSLQRVAKSLDTSSCLQEKLLPQYVDRFQNKMSLELNKLSIYSEDAMVKDRLGHRTGDWSDQVRKGAEDLCVS